MQTGKKMEGYLAHKWGLLNKINTIHPYAVEYPAANAQVDISYSPSFSLQMLSPNAGITNWRVIDPSDPSQAKLYHLTFDDNLSDQLNPLMFYKLGSYEKLSLKNLHPSMEIDTDSGKLTLEGNSTITEREWFNLAAQVDYTSKEVELFLNGASIGSSAFTPSNVSQNLLDFQWIFNRSSIALGFDELRLSNKLRSPEWILAEHENLNGLFPSVAGAVDGEPAFTSAAEFHLQAGVYFETHVSATGNPIAYLASGLPGGMIINPADGNLSGTPVRAGTFEVDLTAFYYDDGVEDNAFDRVRLVVEPSPS